MAKKESEELRNWYRDRYQYVLVQRKILTFITLLSLAGALMAALVTSQLTPLKSLEPFVIQVEPRTGQVHTVNPLEFRELTSNEAVNRFFIVQYIRARENYHVSDLGHNNNLVRLMSTPAIYGDYLALTDANNPLSYQARLGNEGVRQIRIKSMTFLDPNTVQVRLNVREQGPQLNKELNRILLMKFQYVRINLSSEERYINPLGFRVTEYRIDEDIL